MEKMSHIYLIREREFIRMNEQIYKLGKTTQQGLKRSKQYPKDSMIEIHLHVNDCHVAERELLAYFRLKFKSRTDIGAEYFEGDVQIMISAIIKYRYITPVAAPKIVPPPVMTMVRTPTVADTDMLLLMMIISGMSLKDIKMDIPVHDLTKCLDTQKSMKTEEKKEMPIIRKVYNLQEEFDRIQRTVDHALDDYKDSRAKQIYEKHGLDMTKPIVGDPLFRLDYSLFIDDLWAHFRRWLSKKTATCEKYFNLVGINNAIFDLIEKIDEYSRMRDRHPSGKKFLDIYTGPAGKIFYIEKDVYDLQQRQFCDFKKNGHKYVYDWDL